MAMLEFCQNFVFLRNKPIDFSGRAYLPEIYQASPTGNLVLRCSRQVEKSTLICNLIIYHATTSPGIQMILVCPRREQASVFSNTRLLPTIESSPLVNRSLLAGGRTRVMDLQFANGSSLFIRAAYNSADPIRGLSADVLFVDEFQDVAAGHLPVMQETLSHSSRAQTVITGTPKLSDNPLEGVFQRSTAAEWRVPCGTCGTDTRLDDGVIFSDGLGCPNCHSDIEPSSGSWVRRNPESDWGQGFSVNHLMVPWVTHNDILSRMVSYDPTRFKNECLGLPTSLGEHVITRREAEQCCKAMPMAQSLSDVPAQFQQNLIAGLDWAAAGVAPGLVIGYIDLDKVFHIVRFDRYRPAEEPNEVLEAVAKKCLQFHVQCIGVDGGGNGHVYNNLLLNQLGVMQRGAVTPIYAIHYGPSDQQVHQQGARMALDRKSVGLARCGFHPY